MDYVTDKSKRQVPTDSSTGQICDHPGKSDKANLEGAKSNSLGLRVFLCFVTQRELITVQFIFTCYSVIQDHHITDSKLGLQKNHFLHKYDFTEIVTNENITLDIQFI